MSEYSTVPQIEKVHNNTFRETIIPDNSLVTSDLSVINKQSMQVHYDELEPYFGWIREQADTENEQAVIRKAALMTMNNLNPGEAKWEAIVEIGDDENYTLGECIQEGTNTCFQRAVFFNLLMQQANIKVSTLQGLWLITERKDPQMMPKHIREMTKERYFIGDQDKSERHIWNFVQTDDSTFLVDTSYVIKENDTESPVIQKIEDFDPEQQYFTIKVGSETRHYIADGSINSELIK